MKPQTLIIVLAALFLGGPAITKENVKEEHLDPVYFLALDGNVKAAMKKLESIDIRSLSPVELRTRRKYFDRFGESARPAPPIGSDLVDEIGRAYQSYWHEVLLQKLDHDDGVLYLLAKLAPIVERLGGRTGIPSEAEYVRTAEFLMLRLRESGVFSKIGIVKPHLNFMAWKKEAKKRFKVDLGDGQNESVEVVLMKDFTSLGWAAYATFDKMHVGGWVDDSTLYCVAPAYNLRSENFRVSFLAHEARHFSDKRTYKNLSSSDLEYRAKLTEISLANQSFERLMYKFIMEQRNNPENPHSHASYRIVEGLTKKLGVKLSLKNLRSLKQTAIRKFAKELLTADTHRLETVLFLTKEKWE